MPDEIKPGMRLGMVTPERAIHYFAQKRMLLPSFAWQDVYAQEHGAGVAVAGIMQQEVLQVFADELQKTIQAGGDLAGFSKAMRAELQKRKLWGQVEVTDPVTGQSRITTFDRDRLALIFDTNVRQAYAAGLWQEAESDKKNAKWIRYSTANDGRVRAAHQAWHGVTLPVDHPFWRTHWPPNGWRCRCFITPLDEQDIERLQRAGQLVRHEAPAVDLVEYRNKRTGEVSKVPRGIDPGFAYNPGRHRYGGISPHEIAQDMLGEPMPVEPSLWDGSDLQPAARMPRARTLPARVLMQPGQSDNLYANHFLLELGAAAPAPAVMTDAAGHPLVLSKELFIRSGQDAPQWANGQRERYTRLVAQTIANPDEIWLGQDAQGQLQRRYVARFDVGQERISIVFTLGRADWSTGLAVDALASTDTSAAPSSDTEQLLAAARQGARLWPQS